jgi:hypothetical protein
MPGFFLHAGAVITCTHRAPVTVAPTQARVTVSTQFVATASSVLLVSGCPFQIPTPVGPKPQPCVRVQWANVSVRVLVAGQPALLQANPGTGAGVCLSVEQLPAGPPNVNQMQQRSMGG